MWPGEISTSFSCKLNWKWLQPNNSIKVEGNYCIDCLTWRTIMVLVYYNWFSITLVLHRKVRIKFRKLKVRMRISTLPWCEGSSPFAQEQSMRARVAMPLQEAEMLSTFPQTRVCVCVSWTDKIFRPLARTGGRTRSPARKPTINCERCCRKESKPSAPPEQEQ